jgi:hypothetical protein
MRWNIEIGKGEETSALSLSLSLADSEEINETVSIELIVSFPMEVRKTGDVEPMKPIRNYLFKKIKLTIVTHVMYR